MIDDESHTSEKKNNVIKIAMIVYGLIWQSN